MELVKHVSKWGNSAGVLLPKEWLGNQVKVILIDRTSNIRKEVLDILEPYLEDIIGIYLTGSYARGEQEKDSDVDIIAVSNSTKKEIFSGKYHISILTLEGARKTLEKNPVLIVPRLYEARPLLNAALLEELRSVKVNAKSFGGFVDESDRIARICEEFIRTDREQGYTRLDSAHIVYPLILRLRGFFLIHNILRKESYSKERFIKSLKLDREEAKKVYALYKNIRDGEKISTTIALETAEKLLAKLKEEIRKFA